MIIVEQDHPPSFFCSKYFTLLEMFIGFEVFSINSSWDLFLKKKTDFFRRKNSKKMKTKQKNKKKRDKHNKRKKIRGQLKNIKGFFKKKKKRRKNQEEVSFILKKKTICFERDFCDKKFSNEKNHKKKMIKKKSEKNWRERYFSEDEEITTKRDLDTIVFCCKSNCCGNTSFFIKKTPRKKEFSKKLKKFSFLFEKWIQIKKSKNDERTFFDAISNIRNSEINFL